jgi:hypothetical protein
LRTPRYAGRQVWNKQRKDEVLLDVNDVARGYETRLRWNNTGQWVWSDTIAQEPLVSAGDFEAALAIEADAGRARQASHETRQRVRHPLRPARPAVCGSCGRKMQGQYSNHAPYYRCRYPKEYALASHVRHPGNVYLREADILPAIPMPGPPRKQPSTTSSDSRSPSNPDKTKLRADVAISPERFVEHIEQYEDTGRVRGPSRRLTYMPALTGELVLGSQR